jgi:pimeloyl-ACP methyl ester carboxylesterase
VTTFALVHGAFHGAWCWERLTPLLQQAGHQVVAMDLPIEDGSASLETYADAVCAALDGCDGDVVLMGHSYGGHTIPLVAARRPVKHLVYLCALVPEVGKSFYEQAAVEPDMVNVEYRKGCTEPDAQLRVKWVDFELLRTLFYADCDDVDVQAAVKHIRVQSWHAATLPFPLPHFPSIPSTFVICDDDRMLGNDWAKRVARERLNADLIELPGSHSPFLSRPQAVAEVLLRVAQK